MCNNSLLRSLAVFAMWPILFLSNIFMAELPFVAAAEPVKLLKDSNSIEISAALEDSLKLHTEHAKHRLSAVVVRQSFSGVVAAAEYPVRAPKTALVETVEHSPSGAFRENEVIAVLKRNKQQLIPRLEQEVKVAKCSLESARKEAEELKGKANALEATYLKTSSTSLHYMLQLEVKQAQALARDAVDKPVAWEGRIALLQKEIEDLNNETETQTFRLSCPWRGRITTGAVGVGDLVYAGPVFGVSSEDWLKVYGEVTEDQAARLSSLLEMTSAPAWTVQRGGESPSFTGQLRRVYPALASGADGVFLTKLLKGSQGQLYEVPCRPIANATGPIAMGYVKDAETTLKPGDRIVVTLEVPVAEASGEIVVPVSAVVEAAGRTFVVVRPDPEQRIYTLRQVAVVRRSQEVAHVRPLPSGLERKGQFNANEMVVTKNAIDVLALFEDLKNGSGQASDTRVVVSPP